MNRQRKRTCLGEHSLVTGEPTGPAWAQSHCAGVWAGTLELGLCCSWAHVFCRGLSPVFAVRREWIEGGRGRKVLKARDGVSGSTSKWQGQGGASQRGTVVSSVPTAGSEVQGSIWALALQSVPTWPVTYPPVCLSLSPVNGATHFLGFGAGQLLDD